MAKQVQLMPDPPEGCYWERVKGTEDDWELYVGKQLAGKVMAPEKEGGPWRAWMTPPDSSSYTGGSSPKTPSPKTGKAPTRERAAADLLETIDDDWRAELMALKPKPKPEPRPEDYNRVAEEPEVPLSELAALADIAARRKAPEPKVQLRARDWVMVAATLAAAFALGVGLSKIFPVWGDEPPAACLRSEQPIPWAAWSIQATPPDHVWACAPAANGEDAFCVRMVAAPAEECKQFSDELMERDRRRPE